MVEVELTEVGSARLLEHQPQGTFRRSPHIVDSKPTIKNTVQVSKVDN